YIADNPDDCEPRVRRIGWSNLESLSDCIFAGPVLFSETAVNQHRRLRVNGIARIEETPAPERNAHRAEVVGTHYAKSANGSFESLGEGCPSTEKLKFMP